MRPLRLVAAFLLLALLFMINASAWSPEAPENKKEQIKNATSVPSRNHSDSTMLLRGQTPCEPFQPANILPATTGDPLTVAPIDLPRIDCSIQEWNRGSSKPFLTVLCPPTAVFAPLRVYLKLSWLKPKDVPKDVWKVSVWPKEPTEIYANGRAVMVRLKVAGKKNQGSQAKWVGFNGVVDMALIKDSRHLRR